jgi:hypothetical protein
VHKEIAYALLSAFLTTRLFKRLKILVLVYSEGKGKAALLQAHSGAEGSKRLRLPNFKTIDT